MAVARLTLADALIEEVKRLIARGEVAPGDRLPSEAELCRRFQVGRSTVREAMKALALLGLVEIAPGHGTRVRPDAPSWLGRERALRLQLAEWNAREVYEAREALEVALAALAAQRADHDDRAALGAACAAMRVALADDAAFVRANLQFHRALAAAARNAVLSELYEVVLPVTARVMPAMVQVPGVKERALQHHEAVFAAVGAGDGEAARRAMADHMRHLHDLIATLAPQAGAAG